MSRSELVGGEKCCLALPVDSLGWTGGLWSSCWAYIRSGKNSQRVELQAELAVWRRVFLWHYKANIRLGILYLFPNMWLVGIDESSSVLSNPFQKN